VDVFAQGRDLSYADYTATDGATVQFPVGTFNGGEAIRIVSWSAFNVANATSFRTVGEATLTAGQASIPWNYTPGMIDVRINGGDLSLTDYTATDGATIYFTNPTLINASDLLQVASYKPYAVANALPFTGGTLLGPLILAADPTVALGAATKEYVDAVAMPPGTILESAAIAAPAGYLACPTAQTNISRATYPNLFAALTIQTVGTYASGATSISAVGSTVNMAVGYPISGPGIPAGATITAIGSGTLTISLATTAVGTGAAIVVAPWGVGDGSTTFGMPWFPANYASLQSSANLGSQSVGSVISHQHQLGGQTIYTGGGSSFAISTGTGYQTSLTGGSANLAAGVFVNRFVKY